MQRRAFLTKAGGALAVSAFGACGESAVWRRLRLVHAADARVIERTAIADAATLLERATGAPVPVVTEGDPRGALDVVVRAEARSGAKPGGFRISMEGARVIVSGSGAEGARNGLYRLLEHWGFAFFRDGETIPTLTGTAAAHRAGLPLEEEPAFALRGDMIWDNYLGPRRHCAAMWSDEDWERALLFMARNRMNFLEFYPPLERVLGLAFPDARGLSEGVVWKAEVKHALAKRVLARGRALGIQFMYVLSYGAFPEPVRALFPRLEWRNGFLCAHQPELAQLTERVWRHLVEELGTDSWYAIRHRGEEDQPYGDPCRSVTKKAGYLRAFSVLARVDPKAKVTVWTWGEKVPDLFEGFPANVRAIHVRHGMANVFGDRGNGREQREGAPKLDPSRSWLSAQFTVFGGNETLLQTAWSDARALARDASAARLDPSCEGFFQWPEWSDTSPWLSHAIAKIAWQPESAVDLEQELARYARLRHGKHAGRFLAGFLPLLLSGNARFMSTPRKRLHVPFFLAPECLTVLSEVRAGARLMCEVLADASHLYRRDCIDLLSWTGVRQAQTFEAAAHLAHVDRERGAAIDSLRRAEATWTGLRDILAQNPDLSLVSSARALTRVGALSAAVEDNLWKLGCDFYNGYPLVLSPEAIELVYLPQLELFRKGIEDGTLVLEAPGWFWHDFPDRKWADSVRRLPATDPSAFERAMRGRLRHALSGADQTPATSYSLAWLETRLPPAVREPPTPPGKPPAP